MFSSATLTTVVSSTSMKVGRITAKAMIHGLILGVWFIGLCVLVFVFVLVFPASITRTGTTRRTIDSFHAHFGNHGHARAERQFAFRRFVENNFHRHALH